MVRLEEERRVIQDSLQKSADQVTQELAATTAKNTDLEQSKQVGLVGRLVMHVFTLEPLAVLTTHVYKVKVSIKTLESLYMNLGVNDFFSQKLVKNFLL